MLLAINIDNKDISFGIFKNDNLITNYKIKTDNKKSSDELYILFKLLISEKIQIEEITDVIISSVVPEMKETIIKMVKDHFNKDPILIGVGVKTGLNIKCENPKDVGSDRIVNAVSLIKRFGGPGIVVDLSSVITIDVIGSKNEFLGGLILPGIKIFQQSLSIYSAKLPRVEIVESSKVIGNTTTKAIQSGIYYSYKNILNGIIEDIGLELKLDLNDLNIVITGEYSDFVTKNAKYKFKIDKNLTLYGLKILYDINK